MANYGLKNNVCLDPKHYADWSVHQLLNGLHRVECYKARYESYYGIIPKQFVDERIIYYDKRIQLFKELIRNMVHPT